MAYMFDYTYIDSDSKLDSQLEFWHSHDIVSIAMDFEGEFNLHIYGEHLCLVQVFDGAAYFLIDPLKVSEQALRRFLEDPAIEKVMFDCASDASLVRKQYGIIIKNVHDVRLSAQLVGYEGNLTGLVERCLQIPAAPGQKGNQTANWLTRPIKPNLIEYAVSDVEHLFAIREVLVKEIMAAGLEAKDAELQANAAVQKGPDRPGYEKLNGFRYLSNEQKVYLKWFFDARDMLARKLNQPAYRVLDKRVLVDMAKKVPTGQDEFRSVVRHRDKQVEDDLVALLVVAREGATKELQR